MADASLVTRGLRPSEQRALWEREIAELRATIDVLKGALAAESPAVALADGRPWMAGLTRQERALAGALLAVSPRVVQSWDLLDLLPGHDHAEDRVLSVVGVIVYRVRRKLGDGVICNSRGEGYFMPKAERDRLLSAH